MLEAFRELSVLFFDTFKGCFACIPILILSFLPLFFLQALLWSIPAFEISFRNNPLIRESRWDYHRGQPQLLPSTTTGNCWTCSIWFTQHHPSSTTTRQQGCLMVATFSHPFPTLARTHAITSLLPLFWAVSNTFVWTHLSSRCQLWN